MYPKLMQAQFHDNPRKVSDTLSEVARAVPAEGMTLSQLLGKLGEQGLLVFCIFLTIPFLLPIQIPGLGTVFGLLIALIGGSVALNRAPSFPRWLMNRHVASRHLVYVIERGARLFAFIERWACPRWSVLTHNATMKRATGLLLLLAAGVLMLPLIIPFSNVLPALVILLFTVGSLQHDGLFILGGYLAVLGTVVYFVGVALIALHGVHFMMGAAWLSIR
jgi:hypothetical protein